jgi:DNA-binding MarR family transcriptional regulator
MTRATTSGAQLPRPTLLYLMKQVEMAVRSELDDLARPVGLTALQYTALTVLEQHPDLTAARLARHSFVRAQSAADMVGALLERGLIERHRDPSDRRRLVMSLTPDGQRLLDRLRPRVAQIEARMLTPLSADDAHALRASLELCREALAATAPGPDAVAEGTAAAI